MFFHQSSGAMTSRIQTAHYPGYKNSHGQNTQNVERQEQSGGKSALRKRPLLHMDFIPPVQIVSS
jgi:hypothetical protein